MAQEDCFIDEWSADHSRYSEFVDCLTQVAAEQMEFVLGDRYQAYTSYLFVALHQNSVVGFIRIAIQPIGPEANCPPLFLKNKRLTEAKIHAFAVREDHRNKGIGKALQKAAIRKAKVVGCYQVASYSLYEKVANHQLKLSLGFAAQPEIHGDSIRGVYFIMPLRAPEPL